MKPRTVNETIGSARVDARWRAVGRGRDYCGRYDYPTGELEGREAPAAQTEAPQVEPRNGEAQVSTPALPELCDLCGDEVEVEVLEWWRESREFLLSACLP